MKKTYILPAVIAMLLALVSCQEDTPYIRLSASRINLQFGPQQEAKSVVIEAAGTPEIGAPYWMDYSLTEDAQQYRWNLELIPESNTGGQRNGVVQVRCDGQDIKITVSQLPKAASTEKEEKPFVHAAEKTLTQWNHVYKLYNIKENENDIVIAYKHENNYFSVDSEVKTLSVPKDILHEEYGFSDMQTAVSFRFKSGSEAFVSAPSDDRIRLVPLEGEPECIELERWDENGETNSATYSFRIAAARPDLVRIANTLDHPLMSEGMLDNCTDNTEVVLNEDGSYTLTVNDSWISYEEIREVKGGLDLWHQVQIDEYDIKFGRLALKVERQGYEDQYLFIEVKYHMNYEGLTTEKKLELDKALVDFYHAMNGPNWHHEDNWGKLCDNNPTHPFGNTGVKPHIVLKKNAPPTRLFYIDLSGNNIKGVIPDSFWRNLHYCVYLSLWLGEDSPRNEVPEYAYGPYLQHWEILYTNMIEIPVV